MAVTVTWFLAALVFSQNPAQLPKPLEQLKFGMSFDEACKAIGAKPSGTACGVKTRAGEYVQLDSWGGYLGVIQVKPHAKQAHDVLAMLTRHWGEPRVVHDFEELEGTYAWDNAKLGVRAELTETGPLTFRQVTTLEAVMGTDEKRLGFENTVAILGATQQQLLAAHKPWARMGGSVLSINLPPLTIGKQPVHVSVSFRESRAVRFHVVLPVERNEKGEAPVRETVRKRLAQIYGHGKQTERGWKIAGPPRVLLSKPGPTPIHLVSFTVSSE